MRSVVDNEPWKKATNRIIVQTVLTGTMTQVQAAAHFRVSTRWIRIRHGDGSMRVDGHMSTLNVGVGERVAASEHIAGMGNLGFSTGSHLHLAIHPAGSGPVDPVAWFANHGIYF